MEGLSRRHALAALGLLAGGACHSRSHHGPDHIDLPRNPVADVLSPVPLRDVRLSGYLGNKLDLCIRNRIFAQDPEKLVAPFRHRDERTCWQTEFWGKWFLSAVAACEYTGDEAWRATLHGSADELLATQSPDGYIGNYSARDQLKNWDVWGRKYTMLGLLAADRPNAARRLADHLLTQVGPGEADIVRLGLYRGMPSSSILEPIVLLWRRTRDERYLRFAEYIVARWSSPDGPQLVEKALSGVPVDGRFPPPKQWWSWDNGQKAYEMMSCYTGLIELYRETGWEPALQAALRAHESIRETEINVAGSGSSMECWYGGRALETEDRPRSMETCVAMTWMQLNAQLLRITGDPKFGDEIERTAYNALLGAMLPDGSSFAQYSALGGVRGLGESQCHMGLNCCIANGPRGMMLLPAVAVMSGADGPAVNLYASGEWKLRQCSLNVQTDYPRSDEVNIRVEPARSESFALRLRVPAWSEQTSVAVNGVALKHVRAGSWAVVERRWAPGDRVTVRLDLRGRVVTKGSYAAVVRGPFALARDARLGQIDDRVALKEGPIDLRTITAPVAGVETAFVAGQMALCDYASAGNTWDERSRYRTWMPT